MSDADAIEQARNWLAQRGIASPAGSAPAAGSARGGDANSAATEDDEVSAGQAELDLDADPEAVARSIVLRRLSMRAHTRAELQQALTARRVPEHAAQSVLDRMAELGLVDDEGFARDWVESRQQRRHLSRRALQQELTRKGVDRDIINSAVQGVATDDELAAARALVEKKRVSLARLEPPIRRRRLAGLLVRRGYSSTVVATVLSEATNDMNG